MKKHSTMTAREFDKRFDEGEDITPHIDPASIHRPGLEPRRVNVDFPEWIIDQLDRQSKLIGVSRQSLIKLWVSERMQQEHQIQKSLASSSGQGSSS
ncbi:CopG family transcriptional regulator [Oscillatoria amoena NRMC-F 0135]|nr:CopG family transcriptional regulator [Oscillatoria laete-virens]MDL5051088.1 CopG family transcriptional regulator [Oscillatoria amoena NRMC-F 0135]MDL5054535.1 CopG family transcriptional regulator [Oscillatoria laete-virens NRMC-F 0139]